MKINAKDIVLGAKAALLASACCSLPTALAFLFIALGFGSVSAAVRIPQYKLPFIAISIAFLTVSLYYRIRPGGCACGVAEVKKQGGMIIVALASYALITLALIYLILPVLSSLLFSLLSK